MRAPRQYSAADHPSALLEVKTVKAPLLYGRHAAGPRYRSQSNSSLGGSGFAGSQPLLAVPSPMGCACTAWSLPSLPSLPLRANPTANAKCGRFRRCVPAWKICARAPEGLGQRETLGDAPRAGLLAIDVLAGMGRQDRSRSVPVRPRGDEHRIDVAAGQKLAQVAIRGAIRIAILRIYRLLDRLAAIGPHVADGHEPGVGLLQEAAQIVRAAVADADAAHQNPLAGGHRAVFPACRGRNQLRQPHTETQSAGALKNPRAAMAALKSGMLASLS